MNKYFRVFFDADGQGGGGSGSSGDAGQGAEPEVAKYTDKQLNDLIAKNVGKASEKTRAELLAELGADSLDTLKAKLAKQAELEKASMTEAEKVRAELEAEKKKDAGRRGPSVRRRTESRDLARAFPLTRRARGKARRRVDGATVAEKVRPC
jgi:acyl carrier protein